MQEDAARLDATMVVGVRFASSMITQGVSDGCLGYGRWPERRRSICGRS